MENSKILAAFKDDNFMVFIEQDVMNPADIRLGIAHLYGDVPHWLPYWAAPHLVNLMEKAAKFYASEMEKAKKDLDGSPEI
jgi:hypothetical protein